MLRRRGARRRALHELFEARVVVEARKIRVLADVVGVGETGGDRLVQARQRLVLLPRRLWLTVAAGKCRSRASMAPTRLFTASAAEAQAQGPRRQGSEIGELTIQSCPEGIERCPEKRLSADLTD